MVGSCGEQEGGSPGPPALAALAPIAQATTLVPVSSKPELGHLLLLLSHFSRVRLFETPWTVAYQAPLSMGFSRQEYWSGVPCLLHNGLLLSYKTE